MVHLLKSRTDEAVGWLQKAVATNPRLPGPHAWLAAAYALTGYAEGATTQLAEARRLNSDDRYSSLARFKAAVNFNAKMQELAETPPPTLLSAILSPHRPRRMPTGRG
jgi:hypothetical protein